MSIIEWVKRYSVIAREWEKRKEWGVQWICKIWKWWDSHGSTTSHNHNRWTTKIK